MDFVGLITNIIKDFPQLQPYIILLLSVTFIIFCILKKQQIDTLREKIDYLEKYYIRPDTQEQIKNWKALAKDAEKKAKLDLQEMEKRILYIEAELEKSNKALGLSEEEKILLKKERDELKAKQEKEKALYGLFKEKEIIFSGSANQFTSDYNQFLSTDIMKNYIGKQYSVNDVKNLPFDPLTRDHVTHLIDPKDNKKKNSK
jgi:hypothetical protein